MRSYEDIAREIGCSRNNICIILNSAINKIFRGLYKKYFMKKDITPFEIFLMMSAYLNLKSVADMRYVYEVLDKRFQDMIKNDLETAFEI